MRALKGPALFPALFAREAPPFSDGRSIAAWAAEWGCLGDGQVDFGGVFSKLTRYGFDGWAVVAWECRLRRPEDGAREGAGFVRAPLIRVTEKAFDDFTGAGTDRAANRRMLGLEP